MAFAYDALVGFGLKKHIKIITSGKIITSFDMFKAMALGADTCYSARAMMLALGCIQALECNKNNCPTGVATQDPELVAGLVVSDKKERVANYQNETVHSFVELLAAAGLDDMSQIKRHHVYRRITNKEILRYDEIYPYLKENCLLTEETVPSNWKPYWLMASANSFEPAVAEFYES